MSKEKLLKARQLMDDGKYKEARSILKRLKDNPQATKMLEKIDELAPEPQRTSRAPGDGFRFADLLHVLLIGIIGAALFGGIGYVVASSMGITARPTVTPGDNTSIIAVTPGESGGQIVASVPTSTPPPPTEIPCEAQSWWDSNGQGLTSLLDRTFALTVQTPPAEIQALKTDFDAFKAELEAQSVAACLQPTHQSIVNALPRLEAEIGQFLTTSTEQTRSQSLIALMDALLPVTDNVAALSLNAPQSWLQTVSDFTRGECPARRWFLESIEGRDYRRFFTLYRSIDFTQIAAAETILRDMQNFRSAFAADSAAFPECVKTASDHFLATLSGYIGYANNRLGNDMANADTQLRSGDSALANFYAEIARLDPQLSGIRFI